MMPIITKRDRDMIKATKQWLYVDDKGVFHLKRDAPTEIKKHYDKMRKLYQEL